MKILFLLIFVILSCPILFEKSYGQTPKASINSTETATVFEVGGAQKLQNNTEIFVQIELYDSAGRFVGYTEGHPQIFDLDKTLKIITSISHKNTTIREGKIFEILTFKDSISWHKLDVMGAYFLNVSENGKVFAPLYFAIDSCPILPGDTAKILVTVIRSTS